MGASQIPMSDSRLSTIASSGLFPFPPSARSRPAGGSRRLWHVGLAPIQRRRDLRARHFTSPLSVLNKNIQNIAILDFNSMSFRHNNPLPGNSLKNEDR